MTSDLLKCTICPKKPMFSDVSHLLTHVGSKGHLAHLHGLQVRSHQEPDAGNQLTIYNQWFQEHDVAALLSERMQQKEQKQAVKKAANRRRVAANANGTKSRDVKASENFKDIPIASAYSAERPSTIRLEDVEDLDNTSVSPICMISQYPPLDSSPPVLQPMTVDEDPDFVEDTATHVDDTPATTPSGATRLKGTHWPGMALFDAAPEELKRKRNQRKHVSVLQKLERNASLVEPTETVHSATGTVLKCRHMNDLENDSPVEGEEVIVLPSPKKKRTKLPRVSRPALQRGIRKPGRPRRQFSDTPSKIRGVSTDVTSDMTLQPSALENESNEVKLPVRGFGQKKRSKKNTFTIYKDSSPRFDFDHTMASTTSGYAGNDLARSQVALKHTFLPRQTVEAYDPFEQIRDPLQPTHLSFTDLGQGKENDPNPFFGNTFSTYSQTTANPLFSYGGDRKFPTHEQHTSENRLNPIIASHISAFTDNDNFSPVKNPLMVAMSQVNKTEFEDDIYPSRVLQRQPLFAPR